jgi:hypothetical protein
MSLNPWNFYGGHKEDKKTERWPWKDWHPYNDTVYLLNCMIKCTICIFFNFYPNVPTVKLLSSFWRAVLPNWLYANSSAFQKHRTLACIGTRMTVQCVACPSASVTKGYTVYELCVNNTINKQTKQTPMSESASELYRPSDRRLSAKWLPTFVDRRCHVVSVTDLYGCILFSGQEPLLFYQVAAVLTRLRGPRSRPIPFFFW